MKTARIIGSFMVGMLFFSLANNIAAQTICDSIVAIDSLYYYKHQLPYTIIDTTNLPKKVGHEIVVAFGDSVLRFEDEKIIDQEHGDWYNCPYSIIGMDRKRVILNLRFSSYSYGHSSYSYGRSSYSYGRSSCSHGFSSCDHGHSSNSHGRSSYSYGRSS